ncbi:MAG: hypothetical protein ABI216_15965 [Devosia sp.]
MKPLPKVCGLDWSETREPFFPDIKPSTWTTPRFYELWRFARADMVRLGFDSDHGYGAMWGHDTLSAVDVEREIPEIERRIEVTLAKRLAMAAAGDPQTVAVVAVSRFVVAAYRGRYPEDMRFKGRRLILDMEGGGVDDRLSDTGPGNSYASDIGFSDQPYSEFLLIACNFISNVRFRAPIGGALRGWGLRASWMDAVHGWGLDDLPPSPTSPPILVLDAALHTILSEDLRVAEATWTRGGRTRKRGHIAWRKDLFDGSVKAWATGVTQQRAVNRLQAVEDAMEPVAPPSEDADAMMEAFA